MLYLCNGIVQSDVIFVPESARASNEIVSRGAITGAETRTMDINEIRTRPGAGHEPRSRCLADGCPCRDARIVSRRRARFFAHLAETHGETANRVLLPEPNWELPRSI